MTAPPFTGGSSEPRYKILELDTGSTVIIDTERQDKESRLYVLSWTPLDPSQGVNNWSLDLGFMRVKVGDNIDAADVKAQAYIWTCPMYAARKLARTDVLEQVLSVFREGYLEIDYPYELTYRFGGTVHTL